MYDIIVRKEDLKHKPPRKHVKEEREISRKGTVWYLEYWLGMKKVDNSCHIN